MATERLRAVLASTHFILHHNGPLSITVGTADEKAHRVTIGDPHRCSCRQAASGEGPCEHVLFVLLKVFRVPPTSPLLQVHGLREAQLEEVLKGRVRRPRSRPRSAPSAASAAGASGGAITRREIGEDDACPICMESLADEGRGRLDWCKGGCGNSVHRRCMQVWAKHHEHRQRTAGGAEPLPCPYCRAPWGELCPPASPVVPTAYP